MTKLSRKVEYALMALKYIFEKEMLPKEQSGLNDLVSAKDLSEVLGTPFEVTAKILQVLASNKVLRSEKGLQGGYKLAQDLRTLSLQQLVEFVDGPTGLVKCVTSDSGCEIKGSCNIASPLAVLNKKIQNFYQNISVAELFATPKATQVNDKVEDMGVIQ